MSQSTGPDSKPHIVLIPGAGHTGDCYALVVPLLEAEGYSVTALTLPSVGAEPPITSLEPEIVHIRNNIVPVLDKDQNVVVVMHSYGGVPGTSALTGLSRQDRAKEENPAGVTALVYLCARLIPVGVSSFEYGGRITSGDRPRMLVNGDYVR